jgi:hypothetical protein
MMFFCTAETQRHSQMPSLLRLCFTFHASHFEGDPFQ